ncbi:metalloregulator ArsR/SmtB family transcription factor [Frigoribacterium sp. CG_9.8]|uniref:metalloregulator ArsR/SmtB family transcription factor n=1 Tax=Frigoribacterium sp. CG_9.8 TaxID=2787733 RepID=UPI0018CB298E|nr:metalloregulator ArsR/SmtB family transcription factor [Frigoribacterium sp. CG_9.8]MBG6108836.1 protein-tyrosine-phosphatase/DNA-binding transcriptional ArsR family regulator [Frigoribacterium sp. CG_9.8]
MNFADSPTEHPRLDRAAAERIARGLRAMADATRVQILSRIVDAPAGRRAVTELAAELGLSQPTVSHHLRLLSDAGILESTQDGRLVWYSIVPAKLVDVFDSVQGDPIAGVIAPPILKRISRDLATRFAGTFSPQTVSDYVHDSYQLLAERARITRYLPSLTSRFAADRLRSLADADGIRRDSIPDVLFVCVQNAGRSQLASAILRSLAGDRVRVLTAGSEPAGSINPKIVATLDEIGVSIDGEYPKPLTDEVVRGADYVITMGCGDACPIYAGRRYLDWDLPDPAGMSPEQVRAVRDDIDARVRELLADIDAANAA